MGFNLYGCPNTKDTNVIALENKTYLGIWINKLNFENYTNSIFYIDLEINKNSEYGYINNELKVLGYYIKWIENVFEFRKISKHEIESFKKQIEREDIIFNNSRLVNFVDDFKGSKRDISTIRKLESVIIPIDDTTEQERVYLLCLMYLDVLKIKYFLENQLSKFLPKQPEATKPQEVHKTQNLFKLGLLFATGEMNKYFTVKSNGQTTMNEGYSAPKIAKELKELREKEVNHKFITATINNYPKESVNSGKNVFNSRKIMLKIISYCEAEKIPIESYFKSRLPIE
jgi:hypothetical protein